MVKFLLTNRYLILLTTASIALLLFAYAFVYTVKQMPSGDETISYLCATGNQQAYSRVISHSGVYGHVSQAHEWQQFFKNSPQSFNNISADLTQTDLHPPLYFWLLHGFSLFTPSLKSAGFLLNALLHILSAMGLFLLASKLGLNNKTKALAVLYWCISPAIVAVGFYARQYELLGCIGIYTAWAFLFYQKHQRPFNLLLLFALVVAGMLTQYLFMYMMPVYLFYALVINKSPKLFLTMALLIITAFVVVYIIHPGMLQQFAMQQERAQVLNINQLPMRLGKIALSGLQIWLPVLLLKNQLLKLPLWLPILAVTCVAVPLLYMVIKQFKPVKFSFNKLSFNHCMLLGSLGLAIVPYLLFLTPLHAMGGQYWVLVYPFLVLALVTETAKLPQLNKALMALLCIGFGVQLMGMYNTQQQYNTLFAQLKQADVIVVNSVDRRGFLRVVPFLNPQQQIIMREDVLPSMFTLRQQNKSTLFIADEYTQHKAKLTDANTYDLGDGKIFYVQVIATDLVQ